MTTSKIRGVSYYCDENGVRVDKLDELMAAFAKPFEPKDLLWRIGQKSKKNLDKPKATALVYVQVPIIIKRFNDLVGGFWKVWYGVHPVHKSSAMGTIAIKIAGDWVERQDAGSDSNVEKEKGGISDALKRAARNWGVGLFLWEFPKSKYLPINQYGDFINPHNLPHKFYPDYMPEIPQTKSVEKPKEMKKLMKKKKVTSSDEKVVKGLELSRAYIIPEGMVMPGKTLAELEKTSIGTGILKFMAGAEVNPAGNKYTPTNDYGKKLQAAAKYIVDNTLENIE